VDILILGGGGREHALAWRLARDESVGRVDIAPGNGGTPAAARTVEELDALDPSAVARYAARQRYGLVVVGPEAPLAAGVADALRSASIAVFGPSRAAAQLECSKAYAKEQMRRAEVATPECRTFTDPEAALAHLRTLERPPVIKADWLAAGKGVIVPDTHEEAESAIRDLAATAAGGGTLILEERLAGREVSAFALVSDQAVVPLAAACDYKRLCDGDIGPNTGGMGAYTPVPWFGRRELEEATERIFEPIAWRMARDGTPYRGVLYAGLMLTADGPMVLEFNARFGDPEAQVLLPMLDGELSQALLGTAIGDIGLMEGAVAQRSGAAVGVVIAAAGYPDAPEHGARLEGAEPSGPGDDGDLLVFHAGTRRTRDGWEALGGRVVTLVGRGADLAAARQAAYRGVESVALDGGQHRSDIALREIEA
jgi:phosphoribosylamine--glycine ligase